MKVLKQEKSGRTALVRCPLCLWGPGKPGGGVELYYRNSRGNLFQSDS